MPPTQDLIACPHCDTLHTNATLVEGAEAHCVRCGVVLKTERSTAIVSVLALSITSFILMFAAISFPFLNLSASGFTNDTSVLGAVMAFSDSFSWPLAAAVAAFIIFLPLLRLGAIIVAVAPLVSGMTPTRFARQSFGLSEALRPWSMAEIFALGCAVALIKISDLADVGFGPAFWMFCTLVVLVVVQDNFLCRWSVWKSLDNTQTS